MTFTKLSLDSQNRMFRPLAIGLHEGNWFLRTDLWFVGFRITK